MLTIRITRGARLYNIFGAYDIYIDGAYRGKIKRKETKEFAVVPREFTDERTRHTVCASAGRYESNSVYIDGNDSIVELEVGYALTGWKHWLLPYSESFIKKGDYLFLREKEANDTDNKRNICTR